MKKLPFTGSGVAIVTPFDENNEINYDAFGSLIEMHIKNKTDAIVVCGTTGEASAMPDDEHLSAVAYAVNKSGGRIPVIAGCGSNDTHHAVTLSKRAERFGADALLSVTPYYNKTNKKGLYEHFKTIANSVSIPIILYNVPSRTGINIPIETLKELSKIDNISAIKEASGNVGYAVRIASEVPDLYIYSGNDDVTVPIMSVGGVGVISVAANIVPEEIHNMCKSCLNGNFREGKDIQLKISELCDKLFVEVNPIPIKAAMRHLGYDVGDVRMPLGKMEEKNLKELTDVVERFGIVKKI